VNPQRTVFAIVPVKDPALGKTRLAPLLDAAQRRSLCLSLAKRTMRASADAFGASRTIVVTASLDIARIAAHAGLHVVAEQPGCGLNSAIVQGAKRARDLAADALLVVPADLALATAAELQEAAFSIPLQPGCLIVPDRRLSGTNLLGLSPAREDLFAFGEDSLRRHAEIAEHAGCEVRIHHSDALSLDLDLPEDYAAWRLSERRQAASAPEALPL
jgi:2-phospho-L-lactate guanylyltransferase